jgi:hypothetical protein
MAVIIIAVQIYDRLDFKWLRLALLAVFDYSLLGNGDNA